MRIFSLVLCLAACLCLVWSAPASNTGAGQPIARKTNPKDGAAMVWVAPGPFLMGASTDDIAAMLKSRPQWKASWFEDETPQHSIDLDGYWVYTYEVTVAQYRRFCTETERPLPELPNWSKDNHPMVNVSWEDAEAYAEWAGARLPTEAEWEKAARGVDGRRFPWGNTWDEEKCNNYSDHQSVGGGYQGVRTAPVGSYPAGVSHYGAHDMAGNVWEWCADWYAAKYYAASPKKNPTGPEEGESRVLRGGAWGSSSVSARTTGRHADAPDARYHDCGGFRCVVSPPLDAPIPAR